MLKFVLFFLLKCTYKCSQLHLQLRQIAEQLLFCAHKHKHTQLLLIVFCVRKRDNNKKPRSGEKQNFHLIKREAERQRNTESRVEVVLYGNNNNHTLLQNVLMLLLLLVFIGIIRVFLFEWGVGDFICIRFLNLVRFEQMFFCF